MHPTHPTVSLINRVFSHHVPNHISLLALKVMETFKAQLSLLDSSFVNFTYTAYNTTAEISDIIYDDTHKYLFAFEFYTDDNGQPGVLGLSRPKVFIQTMMLI